jgi:hypothetical protein
VCEEGGERREREEKELERKKIEVVIACTSIIRPS